jgi:hypothetical protein
MQFIQFDIEDNVYRMPEKVMLSVLGRTAPRWFHAEKFYQVYAVSTGESNRVRLRDEDRNGRSTCRWHDKKDRLNKFEILASPA